jgi:hypothetical protein
MQLSVMLMRERSTGPRTVEVHIRRLRQKLGTHQPLIMKVRGGGYRLAPGAPIALIRAPAKRAAFDRATPVNRPRDRPPVQRGAA